MMDLLEADGITLDGSGIGSGWAARDGRIARECAVKIEVQPDACDPDTAYNLVEGGAVSEYLVSPVAVLATLALSINCLAGDEDAWLKRVVKSGALDLAVARSLVTAPDTADEDSSPWFGHPDTTRLSGGTATVDAANIGRAYAEWFKHSAWDKEIVPILHLPPSLIPALKVAGVLLEKNDKLVSAWNTPVVASPAYDWGTDSTFAAWTGPIKIAVSGVESTDVQIDGRKNNALDTANVIFVIDTPPCSIVTVGIAAP